MKSNFIVAVLKFLLIYVFFTSNITSSVLPSLPPPIPPLPRPPSPSALVEIKYRNLLSTAQQSFIDLVFSQNADDESVKDAIYLIHARRICLASHLWVGYWMKIPKKQLIYWKVLLLRWRN